MLALILKIWCRLASPLGISRHDPERRYIPPWSGYTCRRCQKSALTAGELLQLDSEDYVDSVGRVGHSKSSFERTHKEKR